jgi:predicted membrane protein
MRKTLSLIVIIAVLLFVLVFIFIFPLFMPRLMDNYEVVSDIPRLFLILASISNFMLSIQGIIIIAIITAISAGMIYKLRQIKSSEQRNKNNQLGGEVKMSKTDFTNAFLEWHNRMNQSSEGLNGKVDFALGITTTAALRLARNFAQTAGVDE